MRSGPLSAAHHGGVGEAGSDLVANLETPGADRGSEGRRYPCRGGSERHHRRQRILDDSTHGSAPSGMGHPYHASIGIGHDDGDAVGGIDPDDYARTIGDEAVDRLGHHAGGHHRGDLRRMCLAWYDDAIRTHPQTLGKGPSATVDMAGVVARIVAHVEAVIGSGLGSDIPAGGVKGSDSVQSEQRM